jgi:hypothetical protein
MYEFIGIDYPSFRKALVSQEVLRLFLNSNSNDG